ncbi:hypothetical protein DFJ73DRAFT_373953 [Zopfochytrium polystomum]|nr:hypothetical protein DFJ73DRAFT_373953 [Zopfochytrium polystomum]
MATIIRELWGVRPAFLKGGYSSSRTLLKLLTPMENHGVGARVIPVADFTHGKLDSFWTITRVDYPNGNFRSGQVFGLRKVRGKQSRRPVQISNIDDAWRLHLQPAEAQQIKSKLGIK